MVCSNPEGRLFLHQFLLFCFVCFFFFFPLFGYIVRASVLSTICLQFIEGDIEENTSNTDEGTADDVCVSAVNERTIEGVDSMHLLDQVKLKYAQETWMIVGCQNSCQR